LMRFLTLLLVFTVTIYASVDDGLKAAKRGHYAKAYENWIPIEQQTDRDVQYYLGYMFSRGYGVAKDRAESIRWYRASAAQGHTMSAFKLGLHYTSARYFDQDEAKRWLKIAADSGIAQAQFLYGRLLYKNFNNISDAKVWLQRAAKQNSSDAKTFLTTFYAKSTEERVAKVHTKPQIKPKQKPQAIQPKHQDICDIEIKKVLRKQQQVVDGFNHISSIEYVVHKDELDLKFHSSSKLIVKKLDNNLSQLTVMFDDGLLKQMQVHLQDGRYHGKMIVWYESGEERIKAEFRDGKLDGILERYYRDGVLESSVRYSQNLPDGTASIWYPNGTLMSQVEYKHGFRDDLQQQWYPDGKLAAKVQFKDDLIDGKVYRWDSDALLVEESSYRYGLLDGRQILYDLNSSREVQYRCGKIVKE